MRMGVTIIDLYGPIFCFQYSLSTSHTEKPIAAASVASSQLQCQERFIFPIDSAHSNFLQMGPGREDFISFHFAENNGSAETFVLSLRVGS